jgi:hypothetical protein
MGACSRDNCQGQGFAVLASSNPSGEPIAAAANLDVSRAFSPRNVTVRVLRPNTIWFYQIFRSNAKEHNLYNYRITLSGAFLNRSRPRIHANFFIRERRGNGIFSSDHTHKEHKN